MGGPTKGTGRAEAIVLRQETPDFAKKWVRDVEPFTPVDRTLSLEVDGLDLARWEKAGSGPKSERLFDEPANVLASQGAPARPAVPVIEMTDVRETLVGLQNRLKISNRATAKRFENAVALSIDAVDAVRLKTGKTPAFAANDGIRSALATSLEWLKGYTARLQSGEATFFDSILVATHLAIVNISL